MERDIHPAEGAEERGVDGRRGEELEGFIAGCPWPTAYL